MAAEQAKAPELELNPEQDRTISDVPDSLLSPPLEENRHSKTCAESTFRMTTAPPSSSIVSPSR
jgi:hypothetical protein